MFAREWRIKSRDGLADMKRSVSRTKGTVRLFREILGRKNTIQALTVLVIALGFVTLGAWIATVGHPIVIWSMRLGAPAAAVVVSWCVYRVAHREDRLPDLLGGIAKRYFEKDGLCFVPAIGVCSSGACEFCIYFQNRNSGHASARVELRPPLRSLWFTRHALPNVAVSIECPGGAFGVIRVPHAIPRRYQGRTMNFDLAADTRYPAERGDLLRERGGLRVRSIAQFGASHQVSAAISTLLLGAFGSILYLSRSATAKLKFPTSAQETLPQGAQTPMEILCQPDLPTGGFPVLPARKAA